MKKGAKKYLVEVRSIFLYSGPVTACLRRSGWVRRVTGHFSGFVSTGSWVCGAGAGQLSHYAVTFGSGDWRLSCRGGPHTHLKHWRPCLESHDPMGLLIINQATTLPPPGNQHQYAFSSYWSFIATCYMFCFASHMGSVCTCYWARRRMRWTSANMSEERHCKLSNVHRHIQTLYLFIITASYNSQTRVTRGVNGN